MLLQQVITVQPWLELAKVDLVDLRLDVCGGMLIIVSDNRTTVSVKNTYEIKLKICNNIALIKEYRILEKFVKTA